MSSDINSVAGYIDMNMAINAVLECLVTNGTISRPTDSTDVDVTSALNTAVQNDGITFSGAEWKYNASNTTYEIRFLVYEGSTFLGGISIFCNNKWGWDQKRNSLIYILSLVFNRTFFKKF